MDYDSDDTYCSEIETSEAYNFRDRSRCTIKYEKQPGSRRSQRIVDLEDKKKKNTINKIEIKCKNKNRKSSEFEKATNTNRISKRGRKRKNIFEKNHQNPKDEHIETFKKEIELINKMHNKLEKIQNGVKNAVNKYKKQDKKINVTYSIMKTLYNTLNEKLENYFNHMKKSANMLKIDECEFHCFQSFREFSGSVGEKINYNNDKLVVYNTTSLLNPLCALNSDVKEDNLNAGAFENSKYVLQSQDIFESPQAPPNEAKFIVIDQNKYSTDSIQSISVLINPANNKDLKRDEIHDLSMKTICMDALESNSCANTEELMSQPVINLQNKKAITNNLYITNQNNDNTQNYLKNMNMSQEKIKCSSHSIKLPQDKKQIEVKINNRENKSAGKIKNSISAKNIESSTQQFIESIHKVKEKYANDYGWLKSVKIDVKSVLTKSEKLTQEIVLPKEFWEDPYAEIPNNWLNDFND